MSKWKPPQEQRVEYPRANPPGLYRCPHCGDLLSGPPRLYDCPRRRQRKERRA